jgi:hypothetical protein
MVQTQIYAWQAYTQYDAGWLVTYGGHIWKCLMSHQSLPGWEPGPATPTLWQMCDSCALPTPTPTPTPLPPGPWAPGISYTINTIVTYNGGTYKCFQPHVSQVGLEPNVAVYLWRPYSGPSAGVNMAKNILAVGESTTADATSDLMNAQWTLTILDETGQPQSLTSPILSPARPAVLTGEGSAHWTLTGAKIGAPTVVVSVTGTGYSMVNQRYETMTLSSQYLGMISVGAPVITVDNYGTADCQGHVTQAEKIEWTAVPNATGYNVKTDYGFTGTFTTVATTSARTYSFSTSSQSGWVAVTANVGGKEGPRGLTGNLMFTPPATCP